METKMYGMFKNKTIHWGLHDTWTYIITVIQTDQQRRNFSHGFLIYVIYAGKNRLMEDVNQWVQVRYHSSKYQIIYKKYEKIWKYEKYNIREEKIKRNVWNTLDQWIITTKSWDNISFHQNYYRTD